jgi:AcrR family transcriptional regulator
MPRSVNSRGYDSPLRREQARATQRAVLDAARRLFVEGGYVATTMNAIAAAAGVSPETVYVTFTNKRSILTRLVDVAIAGDDAPVRVADREWVGQLRDEPDLRRAVRLLARNGRLILERMMPIYEVLRGAAAADPGAAAVLERYRSQRFIGQRQILRTLTSRHPLREGLSPSAAADILFTIGSPETYGLLVRDRRWSAARFERWYADTLALLLLAADA